LSEKLKIGIIWSAIEIVFKRSLDFIVKIILARLLFPDDFGVIGMAIVFISFIQVINDAGMGPAIIQKEKIDSYYLNTVFWTNIIWSILLFLIICLLIAPFAANFYDQPILVKIIPVLSISILTSAMNTVHFSQLRRELNFKKIAQVRNFSTLVAGIIAITLAFTGFGIWALVANSVVAYIITVPLFYYATKWKPSFIWDKNIFKEILAFGIYLTGSKIIINLSGNADYLFLGKFEGATVVGVYTLAFMMTSLVSNQITSMLDTVLFPFYSSLKGNIKEIKKYYLKMIGYYSIVTYPIMTTLFLFTDTIVLNIFGVQWIDSIIPIKVLSVSIMINILTSSYNILFRSIGKTDYEFKVQQLTSVGIYLPLLFVGIYYYGLIGAATAVLVSKTVNLFVHKYILRKHFEIHFYEIFKKTKKVFIISVFLISSVYILRLFNVNEVFIHVAYIILLPLMYVLSFKNDLLILIRRRSLII
jgi:teichuronic acid exporter